METGPGRSTEHASLDSIVIATSPIPISIARTADGRFIVVNDAWVELFGRPREEVLGRTSLEVGFWPSAECRRRWLEQLQRQGGLYGYEAELCDARGAHRNILISSSFIEFADEHCVINFIQDITAHRLAEGRLKEARDMMLAAVSAGQVYPWVWDLGPTGWIGVLRRRNCWDRSPRARIAIRISATWCMRTTGPRFLRSGGRPWRREASTTMSSGS